MGRLPRPHVVKSAVKDARAAASRIEGKLLDVRRREEIDEFLKPLRHSSLGHSPAYTLLRAELEDRARRGQSPADFVRELRKRSENVVKQHRPEVLAAADYLRALRSRSDPHRLKTDVFMPLETRSIGPAEACRRLNAISAGTYGRPTAASDGTREAHSHGSNPHGSNPHDSNPHGSSGNAHQGAPGSPPPSSPGGSGTSSDPTVWSKINHWVTTPEGSQRAPQTLTGLGGSLGVGLTGNAAAVIGGAASIEVLGFRYRSPALYVGAEVSLGAQFGAEADVVAELAFCPPEQFGGWYIGGGVSGGAGLAFLVQVSWALPATGPNDPPQGISVGLGAGGEVEAAMVVGGGKVFFG